MSTLLKITPFNAGNGNFIAPGTTQPTDKSKIRLFRQNPKRDVTLGTGSIMSYQKHPRRIIVIDSLCTIAFIKGMRDRDRRQRGTFDLKGDPNFSFAKPLSIVKFTFQEIGEPDPFRPQTKTKEMESRALYASPNVALITNVTKTDVLSTLQPSMIPQPLMTREQFNTFMGIYEESVGRSPG
ncbi:hypothetical protein HOY82DRAFT_596352 [Tuber indicum]|nr:hypothetical protein HOY82DRAFT_596352 [Tuber indicum]